MAAPASNDLSLRWPARLLILLLVVLLSLPAAIGLLGRDIALLQNLENRRMSPLPPLSLFRESPPQYIEALDSFLKDRVGFRRDANALYRKMRFYLLKDPPAPNISIGRDGFVFMNSHKVNEPNIIFDLLCLQQTEPKPQLVADMDRTFADLSRYYRGRGFPVTIALAPTNVAVYPDKLPAKVERKYRDSCRAYPTADHLISRLQRLGREHDRYRLYYPLELFRAHRDEPYFYPKETWHWSGRSAFLFARDLLRASGVVDRLLLDEPTEVDQIGHDLGMFFGFGRTVRARTYPYAGFRTERDQPDWILELCKQGKALWRYRTENALSDKRGLLISNSFGIELTPHLARGFKEFHFFNLNHLKPDEELEFFRRIVDFTRPDHIYVLFDDAGSIAAPQRLAAFAQLVRELPDSSANGKGAEKSGL